MSGIALRAASVVLDPKGPGGPPDESTLEFQRALIEPFGRKVDEEVFASGAQISHRELTDRLLDADEVRGSRPQLIIVTHALPDVMPFTAIAPYLAEQLHSDPLCFGIAQQGLAAPFTALRLAAAYHRSGRCTEAVLTVLEQTTLPTAMSLVDDPPLIDSAAALVLGSGDGPTVREVASGDSAAELIHDRVPTGDELVVLGPWVDKSAATGPHIYRVPPGSYCTSVWLALAVHWQGWQQAHSAILLCDTDPVTGRSHLAAFDTNPSSRRNGR